MILNFIMTKSFIQMLFQNKNKFLFILLLLSVQSIYAADKCKLQRIEFYSWRWGNLYSHPYTPFRFIKNALNGRFTCKIVINNKNTINKVNRILADSPDEIPVWDINKMKNAVDISNILTRGIAFFKFNNGKTSALAMATDSSNKVHVFWLPYKKNAIAPDTKLVILLAEYIPAYEYMPLSYKTGLYPASIGGTNIYKFDRIIFSFHFTDLPKEDTLFYNKKSIELKNAVQFPEVVNNKIKNLSKTSITCRLYCNKKEYIVLINKKGECRYAGSDIKIPLCLQKALIALIPLKYSPDFTRKYLPFELINATLEK